MGSDSKAQTVGYKYHLGMHAILCHGPVDKLLRIDFEDRKAWEGTSTGSTIYVEAEDLFGGEEREGGVSGVIDVEMGLPSQPKNSYLLSFLGSLMPAFRGVVGIVFNSFYFGMNPYLKRPAFWAQRIHLRQDGIAQWYDAKAAIGQDMNPAHIIRECLTDPSWGMGYPESDIDDSSFTTAADTLYTEGLGLSMLWDSTITIDSFITEVLKHIDGSLYVDRTSGKFVLKLARKDYDIDTILELGENDISKITDFKRSTVGELINSVTVVFWDSSTGQNNSVTVQDIALVAQQQCVISTTKQFPGITTGINATKVAGRSLRALSVPLSSATIYATRKASGLNVGDVFKLSWPRYGITQLVMRVVNIEFGNVGNNSVKIQVIEDVFGQASAIYAPPPSSGWISPITAPQSCAYHLFQEATYWELCQVLGETTAQQIPSTSGYSVITAVRPGGDSIRAKIMAHVGTSWLEKGSCDFTPTALITENLDFIETSIPLGTVKDLDLVKVGTYAILGSEIVSVEALNLSTLTLTVKRAILDTVPVSHTAGERIYFPDIFFGSDKIEYLLGETSSNKVLPVTGKGVLAEALAPVQTCTIQGRHAKPYPPGNVRINNLLYPSSIAIGEVTVTWAHRDRLQQTSTFVSQTTGDIGPESGTTYTINFYNNVGNVLLNSQTGLIGVTASYTPPESVTDLRIELFSVRGGIQSLQTHVISVLRV